MSCCDSYLGWRMPNLYQLIVTTGKIYCHVTQWLIGRSTHLVCVPGGRWRPAITCSLLPSVYNLCDRLRLLLRWAVKKAKYQRLRDTTISLAAITWNHWCYMFASNRLGNYAIPGTYIRYKRHIYRCDQYMYTLLYMHTFTTFNKGVD